MKKKSVPVNQRTRGKANLTKLRKMSEREIARTSPPELADLPENFWDDARVIEPTPKEAISLRVDADILAWFRAFGAGYQTLMNSVLRSYVEHAQKRGPKSKGHHG